MHVPASSIGRFFAMVVLVLLPRPSWPQEVAAAERAVLLSTQRFSLSGGYELHRDRLHYGFENPSAIDTPFFVPHRFDQTYVADNQWFVASARYRLYAAVIESEFGATPRRTAFGSDLDTFWDPNGDVIVSGTKSDVSIRSWRFAQWGHAMLGGLPWHVGYVYRRDTVDFHATERLVSHSSPSTFSRTPIQTHETTISEVHEVPVGFDTAIAQGTRWHATAGADFSPLTIANDTTLLPEKYPGQEIVFRAKGAALLLRAELTWEKRVPLTVSLEYGRTWSYRSSNQFDRDQLALGLSLGVRH